MRKKAIMIVGPTAVGKTALSIDIAKLFNGEVISGDSMQIYRHLDIGTAKVTPAEMAGVPHHLIDICDLDQRFTVHDFKDLAYQNMQQIWQRHRLPMIVGGTGFYLNTLRLNLSLGGQTTPEEDFSHRQYWQDYLQTHGAQALWDALNQKDPVAASKIPVNNERRVIRALEVIDKTGHLFSQQPTPAPLDVDFFVIGLTTERALLYQRINHRVDIMMQQGLLAEARYVYEHRDQAPQASKGIGYKEFFGYFEHHISLDEAIDLVKKNSRHYAKRQLTWFHNQMHDVQWFDLVQHPQQKLLIIQLLTEWLA